MTTPIKNFCYNICIHTILLFWAGVYNIVKTFISTHLNVFHSTDEGQGFYKLSSSVSP